jgi:hypothetical protein
MKEDRMKKIERANLVLGVAVTALAGLIWGGRGMLGAGVGAALACLNFVAIRRLGGRAVRAALASMMDGGGSNTKMAGQGLALAAGLLIKMTALFALVWVAVRVLALPVVPFALGFSVFVLSILVVGLVVGPADGPSAGDPSASDREAHV